jgi:hypothetical protein
MMPQDLWTSLITMPGMADLLALSACVGIYLCLWAGRLRPPTDDQVRGLGLFVSAFSLGNMILAVILNVGLNFLWLEIPYLHPAYTIAAEPGLDSPNSGLIKSRLHSGSLHQPGSATGKRGPGKEDLSTHLWKTIKIWEGVRPRQTEIFSVPSSKWEVDWITAPKAGSRDNFAVNVYSADGNLVQLINNERGPHKGSIFLNRPGKYYLMITSNQKYKIVVKVRN